MAHALPVELLLPILSEGADSNLAKLMSFMLVCRDWRDLIMGEPSLWCHMNSQSTGARQWCLQLARSAEAPLRVRIEESRDKGHHDHKPERFTSIVFREVYISRITELTVLIRNYQFDNEIQFPRWRALADGREWPALRSLRVSDYLSHDENTDMSPLFQLNIRAPVLVNISLYRVSVRSWTALGLGPQTRSVEWVYKGQPNADTVAEFYSILPRLTDLTALGIHSSSKLITVRSLFDAGLIWDKLTTIALTVLDATVQDIEAALRLSPHLACFSLSSKNEITGSYAASYLLGQRGGRRRRLEELSIDHRDSLNSSSPLCNTSVVGLFEDTLDLSTLRTLSLREFAIGRHSPLPSRCTALVNITLFAVAIEPTFIVDLQQCQDLETLSMVVTWDPDWETHTGALSTLDHLTPLPRLRSAELSTHNNIHDFKEPAAAACGSRVAALLGRKASNDLKIHACCFTSTSDIQQLLPQLALHGIHLSIEHGRARSTRSFLDIRLTAFPLNVAFETLSPRYPGRQDMITRSFIIDQTSLANLFEAVRLWVDDLSQVEIVSLHSGIASRHGVPSVVQDAMELLKESRFELCDEKTNRPHISCVRRVLRPSTAG